MRILWFLHKLFVLFTLFSAIITLTACQNRESEPEVQATKGPVPSPTASESLAEEPSEEVLPVSEPDSSETPVSALTNMEEFVSATEFFSVKVPEGWSKEEHIPGAAFIMANSEAALDRYNSGSAVESGDLVLNIGFLPFVLLQQKELKSLDIQFEASPDVFLQSLLPMFHVTGDAATSDTELVPLSDERDAGMLTLSDGERQGMILMFVAGDGVIALVSTAGFPGELGEFQDIAYAIAAEVAFSGAQNALYGLLLGG